MILAWKRYPAKLRQAGAEIPLAYSGMAHSGKPADEELDDTVS
jgi:hypothetical protein